MKRWVTMAMTVGLTFLSACGGVTRTAPDGNLSELFRSLDEAKQKGKVGSVEGYAYLFYPSPPAPLRDWSVTLIPLPPALEATMARSHERFVKAGRTPLTADALQQAQQPIINYMQMLRETGHQDLIKTIKTDTSSDPKFTFQDVPPGRWLLLTALPSQVSTLLWAVPVTVATGEIVWQSLNDKSVWLEGLTP